MNYNRNLFQQINRLTNEVTGSYRSYTPPEPPVVTDTVTITTQPTDITCNIGDTATFTVVAVSDDETATLSYQWQLYDSNWLNIQGATSSSYTAPTLDEKEVNYRCVITSDKGGTATTDTVTLTVQAVPIDTVTIVNQPSDTTAYIGGEFSFVTVADTDDETATLSYQWQIDVDSTWTDISGATHATYVGTAPETTGTADYRCVVTSTGGGTATSDSATLTVQEVPVDVVTITTQPQSATGFIGDTITLSVVAESDDETATLSYQWQIKDGSTYTDISGATSSTYTAPTTTASTERYRVVVTSDKGGTATSNYADVEVTYAPMIIYNLGKDSYLSSQYNSTKGSITEILDAAQAGIYYLIPTTNGYYFAKYDNSTLVYMYNDTSITNYSVNFTSDVSQADVITLTTDGDYTRITKYGEIKYFGWSSSGSGFRYYNSTSPDYNYKFKLYVADSFKIIAQPSSKTINSVPSTILIGAYGATSYQWQYKDNGTWTDIVGATGYSYTINTFHTYDYRCIVSDGTNTITSDEATITCQDKISASVDRTRTTAYPHGSTDFTLPAVNDSFDYAVSATSSGGKTISYSWIWEDATGYTSVVQLSGQTTDVVQLTLISTDAPINVLAGTLKCTLSTPDDVSTGATRVINIKLYTQ